MTAQIPWSLFIGFLFLLSFSSLFSTSASNWSSYFNLSFDVLLFLFELDWFYSVYVYSFKF